MRIFVCALHLSFKWINLQKLKVVETEYFTFSIWIHVTVITECASHRFSYLFRVNFVSLLFYDSQFIVQYLILFECISFFLSSLFSWTYDFDGFKWNIWFDIDLSFLTFRLSASVTTFIHRSVLFIAYFKFWVFSFLYISSALFIFVWTY